MQIITLEALYKMCGKNPFCQNSEFDLLPQRMYGYSLTTTVLHKDKSVVGLVSKIVINSDTLLKPDTFTIVFF